MKYRAFISYTRTDKTKAVWLHKSLERYTIPKNLVEQKKEVGAVPERLSPIFRDKDELGAGGELNDRIIQALKDSEFLIVVCSPSAANSDWVNKEIKYFKELGREKKIIPVIVAGEPSATDKGLDPRLECFPEPLKHSIQQKESPSPKSEPLAADLRPGKDKKHLVLLRLVAGLTGIDYASLHDRERLLLRQRRLTIAMLTILLIAVISIIFGIQQIRSRKQIAEQRNNAINNLGQFYLKEGDANRQEKELNQARLFYLNAFNAFSDVGNIAGISKIRSRLTETPYNPTVFTTETSVLHLSLMNKFLISPNGKLIATAGFDALRIWDAQTGELLHSIEEHRAGIGSMAFSFDSEQIMTGGGNFVAFPRTNPDFTVRVFDLKTGQRLIFFNRHENNVEVVAYSPTKEEAASASRDGMIFLWDLKTQEEKFSFKTSGPINELQFSPNGLYLMARSNSNSIYLWETVTGKPVLHLSNEKAFMAGETPDTKVHFLSSESLAICRGKSGLEIVAIPGGTQNNLYSTPDFRADMIDALPEKGVIAVLNRYHAVALLQEKSKKFVPIPFEKKDSPEGLRLSQSGHLLAIWGGRWEGSSAREKKALWVWDIPQKRFLKMQQPETTGIHDVQFAPSDDKLFARTSEDQVVYWSLPAGDIQNQRKNHATDVRSIAVSPDGLSLVSSESGVGIAGKVTILWDLAEGQAQKVFLDIKTPVSDRSFSPDGHFLALGTGNGPLVWDVVSNVAAFWPSKEYSAPASVLFANQGRTLIFDGSEYIGICSIRLTEPTCQKVAQKANSAIFDLAASQNGKIIAVARFDTKDRKHSVHVVKVESGLSDFVIPGDFSDQPKLALSADGKFLATADSSDTLTLWSAQSQQKLWTLDIRSLYPNQLLNVDAYPPRIAFSPDSDLIAVGSISNVLLLKTSSGQILMNKERGHKGLVTAVEFSPDGLEFVTTSGDGTAKLWSVAPKAMVDTLRRHEGGVSSAQFFPHGDMLATGGEDGRVVVWDLRSGKNLAFTSGNPEVLDAALSPDGTLLAATTINGPLIVWDVPTGRVLSKLDVPITHLAFLDQRTIVCTLDNKVYLLDWNGSTGNQELTEEMPSEGTATALRVSQSGEFLAVGFSDHTFRIWDIFSRKVIFPSEPLPQDIRDFDFVRKDNQDLLAVACEDGITRIYGIANKKLITTLTDHAIGVTAVAFGPKGSLATGGGSFNHLKMFRGRTDSNLHLWDIDKRKVSQHFSGISKSVFDISFSNNGKFLFTASLDGESGLTAAWDRMSEQPLLRIDAHWPKTAQLTPDEKYILTQYGGINRLIDVSDVTKGDVYYNQFRSIQQDLGMQIEAGLPKIIRRKISLFKSSPGMMHWPDWSKSRWQKQANSGVPYAMFKIGLSFETYGEFESAKSWYGHAAQNGSGEAKKRLDLLLHPPNFSLKKTRETRPQ